MWLYRQRVKPFIETYLFLVLQVAVLPGDPPSTAEPPMRSKRPRFKPLPSPPSSTTVGLTLWVHSASHNDFKHTDRAFLRGGGRDLDLHDKMGIEWESLSVEVRGFQPPSKEGSLPLYRVQTSHRRQPGSPITKNSMEG